MHIKLRMSDGRETVVSVSKTAKVVVLRATAAKEFGIKEEEQLLFFSGKQLKDEHTLHDYNINVSSVVQVMKKADKVACTLDLDSPTDEEVPCSSPYFRVGDIVDAKDIAFGAWFVGSVTEIVQFPPSEDIFYKVMFCSPPSDSPILVMLEKIRPVSRQLLKMNELKPDDVVLVNYNVDNPSEIGLWYDFRVVSIDPETQLVTGSLVAGENDNVIDDVKLNLVDQVYKIEENKKNELRTEDELALMQTMPSHKRETAPLCDKCKDNPKRKCKECGCEKCGGKSDPGKQLVCDECHYSFHIWCLTPPLKEVPTSQYWYCGNCRNDLKKVVQAGDKLNLSAKQLASKSATTTSKRDWGKGMACVSRTTQCELVPINHFGPVPGVEVGSLWKFRLQVSESGVHRPHVAGIHGRDTVGAFSLVLSGGYEDDIDDGEEFMYTGSGGRDLSGNRRTAGQSSDQELTRMNRALALNCNAKINETKGAVAVDWKEGLPVRVVRNFKLRKHSKYAPEEGNRYDGLYRVVSYEPVRGQSGFLVWRFKLRRDDPTPPPWTKEGKARSQKLGIQMMYPDGYSEAKAKGTKRRMSSSNDGNQKPAEKKMKVNYKLDKAVLKLLTTDPANAKIWNTLREQELTSHKEFLDKVKESFSCLCCVGLMYEPVTMPCSHNACKYCLQRSFNAGIFTCPACRAELGERFAMTINQKLADILMQLFPGYKSSAY